MAERSDIVRRSTSWSDGGTSCEALAEVLSNGTVVSWVKPIPDRNLEYPSAAFVLHDSTSSNEPISARIVSNKKLLAMSTVYADGVWDVVAKEVEEENQGFSWMPNPKATKFKSNSWSLSTFEQVVAQAGRENHQDSNTLIPPPLEEGNPPVILKEEKKKQPPASFEAIWDYDSY